MLAGAAPVREKRIGLSRGPQRRAMGFDRHRLAFGVAVMRLDERVAAAAADRCGPTVPPAKATRATDSSVRAMSSRFGRARHERVCPLRWAEPADGSGLGCPDRHEVSQIHWGFSGRARTSMTSMCPWPQAGQLVSDMPVRD